MLWVGQMIERLVVLILLVAEVVTLLAPMTLPPASIRCRARSKAAVAIQSSKTMADRDETVVLPNGFKLAVRIWGDPDACPQCPQHRWLALHGWADNAASYDRLAPMMLLEGATAVVAVDFAGHGRSDHRWPTYHDEDDVADVVAVAAALNWTRYSLIGHSLGGCIGQAVAATMVSEIFGNRLSSLSFKSKLMHLLPPLTHHPLTCFPDDVSSSVLTGVSTA